MDPSAAPRSKAVRRTAMLAVVAMAILICYFSVVPAGQAPAPDISDKLRHFLAYGALAIPAAIWAGPARLPAAALGVTAYGAAMEVAQQVAPTGREASMLDALANGLGAVLGVLIVWGFARAWPRR